MTLYRLLLRLLPRGRRERFGDDMAVVFAQQQRHANAGPVLWMRETAGLARFGLRERFGFLFVRRRRIVNPRAPRGGRFLGELHWAWRGLRARGWRLAFVIVLLSATMAANTLVFAAADAFVFNQAPYWQADRLVVVERQTMIGVIDYQSPAAIAAWRSQSDLFSAVHAHALASSFFLTTNGVTTAVRAERITPGLLEMLGVLPAYGRPFSAADATSGAPPAVIVSDSLARRLFDLPERAIDRSISAGSGTARIVGVMPAGFRFPTAREEIWQPLDLQSWPENSNVRDLARLAPGRTLEDASRLAGERVGAAVPASSTEKGATTVRQIADAWQNQNAAAVFTMLFAAAICLLLIACANVGSLELESASRRSRIYAVQTALGASRMALVRSALLEGGLVLGTATGVASLLVSFTTSVVTRYLTAPMRNGLLNAIDLDSRSAAFMVSIAALAWLLTSLPALIQSSRVDVSNALRNDTRVMPITPGAAKLRQFLMAGQVGLTVLLLVGALLYVRTYAARLGLDKGFNAPGLVSVNVVAATDAPLKGAPLQSRVLETVRAFPGVSAASRTWELPPSTQAGITGWLKVKGREPLGRVKLAGYEVDREYFSTMGLPLVAGHGFSDPPVLGELVVDDAFARKYWPNGDALGAHLKVGGPKGDYDSDNDGSGWGNARDFEIVGITSRLRADQVQTSVGDGVFIVYTPLDRNSVTLMFVVRMQDPAQLPALTEAIRRAATRSVVLTDTLENRYAALDADKRLAAATTSAFGILALSVATVGIYGVLAFLVAGRRREIGIRMALGANRGDVRRLVFSSSLRFVLAGAGVGLCVALVASRWIAAQLFGVTTTDPATYATVTALVVVTALAATWYPARQASQVDPAITLRAE